MTQVSTDFAGTDEIALKFVNFLLQRLFLFGKVLHRKKVMKNLNRWVAIASRQCYKEDSKIAATVPRK